MQLENLGPDGSRPKVRKRCFCSLPGQSVSGYWRWPSYQRPCAAMPLCLDAALLALRAHRAINMAFILTPPAPVTTSLADGPAYFVIRDGSKRPTESTIVSFEFAMSPSVTTLA